MDAANGSPRWGGGVTIIHSIPEALPFCRAYGRDQVLPGLGMVLRHWQEHCGGLTSQSRKGEDHSGGTASRRHHLSDLNEEAGGVVYEGGPPKQ